MGCYIAHECNRCQRASTAPVHPLQIQEADVFRPEGWEWRGSDLVCRECLKREQDISEALQAARLAAAPLPTAEWKAGETRVFWLLCGVGTFQRWAFNGEYSFCTVHFDNGVPREYSTSNPCLVTAKDLTVIAAG